MRTPAFWLLVALSAAVAHAAIPADDGPLAHRPFVNEIGALLRARNYDELEARAARLRESKEKFTDGEWKLTAFYAAVGAAPTQPAPDFFTVRLERLEAWASAKPESATPLIARARLLRDYAWNARGSKSADRVEESAWPLFFTRLDQARSTLDRARRLSGASAPCPYWFDIMMSIALGRQASRIEYERLFAEATTAYPDYPQYYFHKAYFLLPRWYGEPGELRHFALEVRERRGPAFFARLCWSVRMEDVVRDDGFVWTDIRDGFEALLRQSPDSAWNLNCYARFTYTVRDRETATRLFRAIGDDYYSSAWASRALFDRVRKWALEGTDTPDLTEALSIPVPKKK